MKRTWMTALPSKAPLSFAVSTEASVWTASAATRAPALRGMSVSTARGTSMSASPGPATPQGASTACSWSTITSAAAAWDTLVSTPSLHTVFNFSPSLPVALRVSLSDSMLRFCSSRSSLRVNGGSVLVQAVPQRRRLLHEHKLCARLRLLLPSCKFSLFSVFFLSSFSIKRPVVCLVFLVAAVCICTAIKWVTVNAV